MSKKAKQTIAEIVKDWGNPEAMFARWQQDVDELLSEGVSKEEILTALKEYAEEDRKEWERKIQYVEQR